jgi:hypothetical protein
MLSLAASAVIKDVNRSAHFQERAHRTHIHARDDAVFGEGVHSPKMETGRALALTISIKFRKRETTCSLGRCSGV